MKLYTTRTQNHQKDDTHHQLNCVRQGNIDVKFYFNSVINIQRAHAMFNKA